jgi:hypothetical protein
MASYHASTYTLEISAPAMGWLKLAQIRSSDIENWIEMLSYTDCEWTLTRKVDEEQPNVQR